MVYDLTIYCTYISSIIAQNYREKKKMNTISGASSVPQAQRLAATGRRAAAATAAERSRAAAAAAANNNNNDPAHPPPAATNNDGDPPEYDPQFHNHGFPRQRGRPRARAHRAATNRPERRRPVDVEAQAYPHTSQEDREEYLNAYLEPTTYEPVIKIPLYITTQTLHLLTYFFLFLH